MINKTEQDLEKKDSKNHDRTVLHVAAKEGYPDIVKALLDKGANKEAKDKREMTPLTIAVMQGHPKIAQLLLEAKCDPNPVSNWQGF